MKGKSKMTETEVVKLSKAFAEAIGEAFKELPFPLECLDWLSFNPDKHIALYNVIYPTGLKMK